jgi:hypothetical protein
MIVAQEIQRLTLSGTVHAEHIFASGRDGLDVMAMLGANYRFTSVFRAGIEYVAQDIEGLFDPEEVEGMRHFVSPTIGVDMFDGRLALNAGPAFGLSRTSPALMGRLGVSCAF